MKEILIEVKAFIKRKIGMCNAKGCYEKSIKHIEIDCIKVKRSLCKKHLEKYEKLVKDIDKQFEIYKEMNGLNDTRIKIDTNSKSKEKVDKKNR